MHTKVDARLLGTILTRLILGRYAIVYTVEEESKILYLIKV